LPIFEVIGTTANEKQTGHTLSFEMCHHDELKIPGMINKHQSTTSMRDELLVMLLGVATNQHALQIYKSFM
jgi:hypothetical protein